MGNALEIIFLGDNKSLQPSGSFIMTKLIETAFKTYYQAYPLKLGFLQTEDWTGCDIKLQQKLLRGTVDSYVVVEHFPAKQYQLSFFKYIIKKLEDSNIEICDELYQHYTELVSSPLPVTEMAHKIYFIDHLMQFITLKESVNYISQGTTGLCTWQAAMYLAEWSLENKHIFSNMNVIELGSGVGLTGMTIAEHCNPRHYTFTDCHQNVLQLLKENINTNIAEKNSNKCPKCGRQFNSMKAKIFRESNISCLDCFLNCDYNDDNGKKEIETFEESLQSFDGSKECCGADRVDVCEIDDLLSKFEDKERLVKQHQDVCLLRLDWENVNKEQLLKLGSYTDVIVAADVVYDTSIIPSLVNVLIDLLVTSNSKAYIASTVRNEQTTESFHKELESSCLTYRKLSPPTQQLFLYDRTTAIELIEIKRQTP